MEEHNLLYGRSAICLLHKISFDKISSNYSEDFITPNNGYYYCGNIQSDGDGIGHTYTHNLLITGDGTGEGF